MTKIEQYLANNYSDEVCKTLTDLYLDRDDLEGEVNLKYENFPKLERVWYHHKLKILTGFDLNLAVLLEEQKAPKGIFLTVESHVQILKYVPIKEKMAELFPDEEKNKTITTLDLTQKGLRGSLDLGEFENLEELTINMDCPWDRKNVNSNYITGINFADAEKIKKLTLTNNPNETNIELKYPALINLEEFNVTGDSKYPAQWTGSLKELEPLKNLTKLNISYCPNIKTGLENIENLEEVEVKGTSYERSLKSFAGDVNAWKAVVYSEKVSNQKEEVIKEINELLTESHDYLKRLNEKGYTDRDLVNKIELLESKSRELITK